MSLVKAMIINKNSLEIDLMKFLASIEIEWRISIGGKSSDSGGNFGCEGEKLLIEFSSII
jgi:hypothetical protein